MGAKDSYLAGGGDVTIGSDVWVCMEALVLGGVTIGAGAIVAGRQLSPETCHVGGVPARTIGEVPE